MTDADDRRSPRAFWWIFGTGCGLVLLLVAAWGLQGWRYASGEPTITFDVLPLLLQDAPTPVPGEAAWPVLKEVMEAIPEAAQDGFGVYGQPPDPTATPEQLAETAAEEATGRAWLAANRGEVLRLLEAVESPALGWEPGEPAEGALSPADGLWAGGIYPHVRRAGALLAAEASLAIEAGDAERAERAVLGLFRLVGLASEVPTQMMDWMIPVVQEHAREVLALALDAKLWDAEQLDRIEAAAALDQPLERALRANDGDRILLRDTLQRIYTDDGEGGGRIAPAGADTLGLPVPDDAAEALLGFPLAWPDRGSLLERLLVGPVILANASPRAEQEASLDRKAKWVRVALEGEGEEALRARRWLAKDEAQDPGYEPPVYDIVAVAMSGLASRVAAVDRDESSRAGTLAAIAAHRFRLAHGRSPATPAEAGAADRSPAGEIFFTVRGDRLLVYAAGADGDDDGGRTAGSDFGAMPPIDPDDSASTRRRRRAALRLGLTGRERDRADPRTVRLSRRNGRRSADSAPLPLTLPATGDAVGGEGPEEGEGGDGEAPEHGDAVDDDEDDVARRSRRRRRPSRIAMGRCGAARADRRSRRRSPPQACRRRASARRSRRATG